MLSKFFRVANGIASKNKITMVFINQIRDNVGQMFGDTTTTTGGKALAFYASQRIKMNKNKIMASDPIKEEEGVKISCIIHKNRFAGRYNPYTKCIYYARYNSGIDSVVAVPQFLLDAGIIRQAGAWLYYEDSNGNPYNINGTLCKFSSRNAFLEALRTNKVLFDTLVGKLNNVSQTQNASEIAEIEKENTEINNHMDNIIKEETNEEIQEILEDNISSDDEDLV